METKRLFELNSFSTNDYESEQNFRETCLWYESKFFVTYPSSQAYQKYINNYHKAKSLYLITEGSNYETQLAIYDTESEIEDTKILKTLIDLDSTTIITLLPNCELFCFCTFKNKNSALIIDSDYSIRLLPTGLSLFSSSAIYFNSCIYCFGGLDKFWKRTTVSRKFDLNENRWTDLTPMPNADYYCHSVIINQDILICGFFSKNLLLYSVDVDSFSIILYDFSYEKRKILINAERLYLIECFGSIYESENENAFAWKWISKSVISHKHPLQTYCLYNKGKIYSLVESIGQRYFKFDIKQNYH